MSFGVNLRFGQMKIETGIVTRLKCAADLHGRVVQ
jgi:hypothetical protein